MFDRIQIPYEQKPFDKSNTYKKEKLKAKKLAQRPNKAWVGDISRAFKKKNELNRASKEKIKLNRSAFPKQTKNQAGKTIGQTPKMRNNKLIYILIIQLASILERDWEEKLDVTIFIASCNNQDHKPTNSSLEAEINPFQILAISIQKANAENLMDFSLTNQLDI